MQRKISNTKKVWSGIYLQCRQKKLHSIPIIINKVKSSVLYSIPCGCVLALLLASIIGLMTNNMCYAFDSCPGDGCAGSVKDYTTISSVSGGTTTPPTASLSISNTNMSQTATPGSTATVNTNVAVNVGNAESYSLTLKMNSDKLTSGSTTINAGNVTTDNTWGYAWNGTAGYTAPSTSTQTLAVPSLSNGSASFTRELKFGVKFASSADAGHYKGSGTLSLVATPKAATYTLADLTQMQQLAEGYAPDACKNTVIPSGQDYAGPYTLTDVRDNNTYTVYKFKDGKCWMTENLKLSNTMPEGDYIDGRVLNSTTSDISASTWTLPASSKSGFSDNTAINVYYNYANASTGAKNTGYYTWCAATAGTCSSATSDGANASSSICPKGWKLPTGGTGKSTDFWLLFRNMGLTISNDSLASSLNGYTNWGSGDLAKVQGPPYNFAYTGYMHYSSTSDLGNSCGYWWSRTAYDSNYAYRLNIGSSSVFPGTNIPYRRSGFAVRCVAGTPSTSSGEATNPR